LSRVLIIATTTGYQIRSFGEAAEKLGVRLVFASDRCDQLDDPRSLFGFVDRRPGPSFDAADVDDVGLAGVRAPRNLSGDGR
jgi:hypothetical protein